MPVIVNSQHPHPFLPSLGNPQAIEQARALRQDIRPLEIAIINLMADKQTTERQLAVWLGATPLQVKLTFAATDSYLEKIERGHEPRHTPKEHLRDFYNPWSAIKNRKFDGMILTGVNALKDRVEDESFWSEVASILDWSATNVFASLYLCWGAKAALKHFHDIDSHKRRTKLFGLFQHRIGNDSTGLLAGFPDIFPIPVSRWKEPQTEDIEENAKLEIAALSGKGGPNIVVEPAENETDTRPYPKRTYLLGHPEYETNTLAKEYKRDSGKDPKAPLPYHYFPGDDSARKPVNTWRHTGAVYANWAQRIYSATPYGFAL